MATTLPDFVIKKVTPGKPSTYFSEVGKVRSDTSITPQLCSRDLLCPGVPADLTIYIKQMKISKTCRSHLSKILKAASFPRIKWSYRKFSEVIQSPEMITENTKFKVFFTIQYTFEIDLDFLETQSENPVMFEFLAVNDECKVSISKAELHLGDILRIVNKKEHARLLFSNEKVDPLATCIAYMDLWYKFTSSKKQLRNLYTCLKSLDNVHKSMSSISSFELGDYAYDVPVTSSEIDQFADHLLMVLKQTKSFKTSKAEIAKTLKERVRWLRDEINLKRSLQENLDRNDSNALSLEQWREEDISEVDLNTYDKLKSTDYKPELAITVEKLYFLDGSAPLRKENIQQVYVEYSFLGLEGPEMETPLSLPKGTMQTPAVFNWTKTFNIDLEKDLDNCYLLAHLIKNKAIIKFLVISEPLETVEKPVQVCEEVGYAEVPLEEVIHLDQNTDTYDYEILDFHNPIAVVGYLTVKFDGILAMKKMVLTIMAPKQN